MQTQVVEQKDSFTKRVCFPTDVLPSLIDIKGTSEMLAFTISSAKFY